MINLSLSSSYPLIYDQFNGFHQGTYLPHFGVFPQNAYGNFGGNVHRNPSGANGANGANGVNAGDGGIGGGPTPQGTNGAAGNNGGPNAPAEVILK